MSSDVDAFASSIDGGLNDDRRLLLVAVAELVGRTGAKAFEIGFTGDDKRSCTWFAFAQYPGARILVEGKKDPVDAASALAVRLLSGGKCKCGRTTALFGVGIMPPEGSYLTLNRDGVDTSTPPGREGFCEWTLEGGSFKPGCPEEESIW